MQYKVPTQLERTRWLGAAAEQGLTPDLSPSELKQRAIEVLETNVHWQQQPQRFEDAPKWAAACTSRPGTTVEHFILGASLEEAICLAIGEALEYQQPQPGE